MGLMAIDEIPFGETFGPIPPMMTLTDPAYLIGHMTLDKYPDIPMTKVDLVTLKDTSKMMEWLPFINPSRDEHEMNVEVFSKDRHIYYRVIKTIYQNQPITAWYSRQFALILGIPEVQPFYVKEDGLMTCPMCNCKFHYPNTLRAHMRFKCDFRRRVTSSVNGLDLTKNPTMFTISNQHPRGFCTTDFSKIGQHKTLASPNKAPDKVTSHSISNLLQDTDRKRKWRVEVDNEDFPPKRRAEVMSDDDDDDDIIDVGTHVTDVICLDKNQNVNNISETSNENDKSEQKDKCNSGSAFRKVEKSQSPKNPISPPGDNSRNYPSMPGLTPVRTPIVTSPVRISENDIPTPLNITTGYRPQFNAFPVNIRSQILPPVSVATAGYTENFPINLSDAHAHRLQMKATSFTRPPLPETLDRPLATPSGSKMQMYSDMQIPGLQPHNMKPTNPMVERLLTLPPLLPSSMNMVNVPSLQNWCAKCNATFRMTSDLVYHMRSHHKREFDPVKRKREEKLKCTVCNETFKERHHLTRHMSSHA
ncbi:zinc finger protein 488-like [Tubulanus polymorphus]|uniref:zinc finger protein 488-like n=1 Tax=Tubulanus polymorphus TaxID=672921 RepID=UPI003DA3280C